DKGMLFRMSRDVVQFHDASILWPDAPRAFLDLWQEFMDEEWPLISEKAQEAGTRPVGRVLPVGESIDDRQKILACEDVIRIIDNAEKIAVTNCTCRLTAQKCDAPIEICLQVDGAADYTLERGTGREVDREEARKMIYEAEDAGLIHATMNREGNLHFICNCCPCCCMVFPLLIHRKLNTCDPSRFRAMVRAEDCTGCAVCMDRCYFGAISIDNKSGTASVSAESCMGCGLCGTACPEKVISLVEARDADFIPS
ncbi:MAG: 4Fe-4S binding protein, partial [Actinobacteria bacterium]|nr:4Fe-4S binding protein [Actinomycetota bacterium]